ncbi:MAG: DUF4038 domain-containing protein [Lachnospiraceae bacterium]
MKQREALKYGVVDCSVHTEVSGNPFDRKITGYIVKPDGTEYSMPAFYNGGDEYKVRLYTDIVGGYSYKMIDEATNTELGAGDFVCVEHDALYGKLVKSKENNTKIEYANGMPYYMLGFEADWLFLLDDEQSDFPKAKTLVDTVEKYGFNMIVLSLFACDVTWKKYIGGYDTQYDFSNPKQGPFKMDGDKIDYDTLDVDFFKRVDMIMEYMMHKNMSVHFMIYVWNKFVPWPKIFSESDNRFYEYVLTRYQAFPNLIWDVSKEALLYGNVTSDDIYNKALYLKEHDVYGTLVTVHDAGFCKNHPDVIDIYSVQNWMYDIQAEMGSILDLHQGNIICNVEHGGYEKGIFSGFHGAYENAEMCFLRNMICTFMGIYTVYYWQNTSWNIVVWDMESLNPEFRPKLEYYQNLRKYMEYMHFEKAVVADKFGRSKLCMDDGENYYVFKPTGMSHVHAGATGANVEGNELEWYNPIKDEYISCKVEEHDVVYGIPCPWRDEMAILKMKKREQAKEVDTF